MGKRAVLLLGVLLLAGAAATAVALLLAGSRQHDRTVDGFARAAVGCTTGLRFDTTGTFYVYEETDADAVSLATGCTPSASGDSFGVELVRPGGAVEVGIPVDPVTYATADHAGTSILTFQVPEPGEYQIVVRGPSARGVAAVGRDPGVIEDQYRTGAVGVAAVGGLLGLGLIVLGLRLRLKQASPGAEWPPAPPTVDAMLGELAGSELAGASSPFVPPPARQPPPEPVPPASPWAPPAGPPAG